MTIEIKLMTTVGRIVLTVSSPKDAAKQVEASLEAQGLFQKPKARGLSERLGVGTAAKVYELSGGVDGSGGSGTPSGGAEGGGDEGDSSET